MRPEQAKGSLEHFFFRLLFSGSFPLHLSWKRACGTLQGDLHYTNENTNASDLGLSQGEPVPQEFRILKNRV